MFKKPDKEDMPIVIISIAIVIVLAISSAISKSEETGQTLTFPQWFVVNMAIIGITVVMDMAIIKDRENKRKYDKIRKEREEKEITMSINIKSGAIGRKGMCEIHQLFENNLFYFDDDIELLYKIVGYEWDGAKYKEIMKLQSQRNQFNNRNAVNLAGKSRRLVGAIGNVNAASKNSSNGEVEAKKVEEMGTAIIRMERIKDGQIISFIIDCDSEIDKQIRCFNNLPI